MALSALDFPFCFLAVRWLGTERIGRAEQAATAWVQRALPVQIPEPWRAWWRENVGRRWRERTAETGELAGADVAVEGKGPAARVGYDHGVREAEAANRGEGASTWDPLRFRSSSRAPSFARRMQANDGRRRHLDAAGARVRHPQVLHLPARAARGRRHAQGGPDPARLGLEHRQAPAPGGARGRARGQGGGQGEEGIDVGA